MALGYQYGEMGKTWTPERETTLLKLLDEGVRPCVIATQLGITPGMLAGKMDRIRRKREKEKLASQPVAQPTQPTVRLVTQVRQDIEHHQTREPAQPRDTTCKWPTGDPMSPSFHLCGKQVAGRGSYCADHMAISRQPRRA